MCSRLYHSLKSRSSRAFTSEKTTSIPLPNRGIDSSRSGCRLVYAEASAGGTIMKIVKIEDLHCDAGWRDFSFLKITTDDGIVGWSEYNEGYGSAGLTAVIRRMAAGLIGENPRAVERIMSMQYAITRQAPGGINQQAMAAIENALLDVKAKSLGVPVYELFGGKVRDRLPLYWSHCGSYRFRNAEMMGVEPVRSFDDVVKLGKHVKERGFKALKTNIFRFDLNPANMHQPGFGRTPGGPELNAEGPTLKAIADGLA